MYQKLASIVCVSLILMITSCTDTNPDKYQLEDTWGADGTWKAATTKKKNKAKKKVVKATSILDVTEIPKVVVKKVVKPKKGLKTAIEKKENSKIDMPSYLIGDSSGWQKLNHSGLMNSYFVKENESAVLNFSVSIIKTMGENDLKQKFKDTYLTDMNKSFAKFKLLSNKTVHLKNKESWELTYSFEKDGTNLTQKQTFVPHSNNMFLLNCTAPQESFSKAEVDFNKITNSIKFN